jgi:hypothetical protein
MQTTFATDPGTPGRPNEDYAVCGPDWAVILDGATPAPGVDSGCVHGVPWLVRHLAQSIASELVVGVLPLADVLCAAIITTGRDHARTCDLSNPDSPSSTVAILRARDGFLDYLVLGDSPVILRRGDESVVRVADDRTDHLPGGRPYSVELVREHRNKPGGFWVASTNARAAYEAISGSADGIDSAAMLTDGATRLADWYGVSWTDMLAILEHQGPAALIQRVRKAENASPPECGKAHDDATAVWATGLGRPVGADLVPDPLIMAR